LFVAGLLGKIMWTHEDVFKCFPSLLRKRAEWAALVV
jgi:hypothetical protein